MSRPMFPRRLAALALLLLPFGTSCAFNALGRAPTDLDLRNNGSEEEQNALYHRYEVVYQDGVIRRPGADPAQVAAEIHVEKVDQVSAPAWSDDAYNYLSASEDAMLAMEHPSIALDQFAHSGNGELVIMGLAAGGGMLAGGISWFVPTTVRDGIDEVEQSELLFAVSGGFFSGVLLGVIAASAYTYIVPNVTTPFASPQYRAAVRAFNDDLSERIVDAGPSGDPPPQHDDGHDDAPGGEQPRGDEAGEAPSAPPSEPRPIEPPANPTPK